MKTIAAKLYGMKFGILGGSPKTEQCFETFLKCRHKFYEQSVMRPKANYVKNFGFSEEFEECRKPTEMLTEKEKSITSSVHIRTFVAFL